MRQDYARLARRTRNSDVTSPPFPSTPFPPHGNKTKIQQWRQQSRSNTIDRNSGKPYDDGNNNHNNE